MKFSIRLLMVFLLGISVVQAQKGLKGIQSTKNMTGSNSTWILGVGINAVDDSGGQGSPLLAIEERWNIAAYPSRFSLGGYFASGVTVEGILSFNRYKTEKLVEDPNPNEPYYTALDTRITYSISRLFGRGGWLDPYVGGGLGYTWANTIGRGTFNATLGLRIWLSGHWGFDVASMGKWTMNTSNGSSNHIQHSAGLLYKF